MLHDGRDGGGDAEWLGDANLTMTFRVILRPEPRGLGLVVDTDRADLWVQTWTRDGGERRAARLPWCLNDGPSGPMD